MIQPEHHFSHTPRVLNELRQAMMPGPHCKPSGARRPNPQVQQFLAEANKAAHIAAQARYVAERKTMQQGLPPQQQAAPPQPAAAPAPAARQAGGSKASVISGEDQTWNCGSCSTTNYLWREFCSKCKKPTHSPYGTDKMSQTRKV